MGRAHWAPLPGSLPNQKEWGAWLSPACLHSMVTFHAGVRTVDRNLITETVPSTAGCHLVGTLEGSGVRRLGWVSSCSAHSHCCPRPVFLLQDHIPVPYQPDSSSNPSSTTSSTPSSPAPPLPPSATPPSPLHPSPQCTRQQKAFNLPGTPGPGEAGGVGFLPGPLGGTLEGM